MTEDSTIRSSVTASLIAMEIAQRFGVLRRIAIHELNRRLEPFDASVPLYNVLFRLATEGPLAQQELTLDAGLDAAGVSRLVQRMGARALVTVRVDTEDRRRRIVSLTASGRDLEQQLTPIVAETMRGTIIGLDSREEQVLLDLLDRTVAATQLKLEEQKSPARGFLRPSKTRRTG